MPTFLRQDNQVQSLFEVLSIRRTVEPLVETHCAQRRKKRLAFVDQQLAGKDYLMGAQFTVADAYFAPVCMRLKTYDLPVPPVIASYVDRVCALPGVQAWVSDALAEKDFLDFEEPYRLAPQAPPLRGSLP